MLDTRKKTEIVWVPTWRCNLKCPYCDYRVIQAENRAGYLLRTFDQEWEFGREFRWPEWIVCLNRFRPYHLELTGGEPLMYKDLPDLLAHVPADSSWAITSNTLLDVRAFEPGNCKFWTASYHYHSRERFMENVDWLRRRGFPIRATLVLTPENHEQCFEEMLRFRQDEVMVNVHPVLKQGFSWKDHPVLLDMARRLHDGIWVNFVEDVPKEWAPRKFRNCNAGGKYFALMPDGTVLRCYSALLWQGRAGHILNYEPSELFRPCGEDCMFHCDMRARKSA